MITKKEYNKRVFVKYFFYSLGIILGVFFLLWLFRVINADVFFIGMENKTFDLRQKAMAAHKVANDNIVIVTVDNASYEYLVGKYGEWPMPRKVYADIADYIEQQKPAVIAFDLMFVNSLKSSNQDDLQLAKRFAKYDNLYTSINFDNLNSQIRKPENLPEKLSVNLKNDSKINFKNSLLEYTNCRMILKEIIDATSNIGHINLIREEDGIARRINPIVSYQGNFYPHLALKVGIDYLKRYENIDEKNLYVNKKMDLIVGNRKIPLDILGGAILNWYGASGEYNKNSFKYIPLWQVEKLTYGETLDDDSRLEKNYFKDKIVYIGVSATSMYDIKSTPVERNMPGVEMHATFINNLIDNNFIWHIPLLIDLLITLLLSLLVGFIVLRFESTVMASLTCVMCSIFYVILSAWVMNNFNIWVSLVFPLTFMLLTFICVYLVKYFRKSRDFEHTYKLATTDGLTELYNHRYFQEQMIQNIKM